MALRCARHIRGLLLALPVITVITACRDEVRPLATLERAIETELRQRFGVVLRTRCTAVVPACVARGEDGSTLPIAVTRIAAGGWDWHVAGLVIASAPLEAYLRQEVADMGAPQAVGCGMRIRRVVADERIACELARGGIAFVTIRADGSTSIEVELDPAAAIARAEPVTADRDAALSRASRALEDAPPNAEGVEEEAPARPAGAGVADPR